MENEIESMIQENIGTNKLISEKLLLQIEKAANIVIDALKNNNHGITLVPAQGAVGPVKILFTIIKRKDLEQVALLIRIHNPTAFYSVEDIRDTSMGVFSNKAENISSIRRMFPNRKGK